MDPVLGLGTDPLVCGASDGPAQRDRCLYEAQLDSAVPGTSLRREAGRGTMESFERTLGSVIAETRRTAGLSQEALAFACKLHPTYISQLERGLKSPTVRVLRLIAHATGTEPSALLHAAESRV